MSKIGKNGGIGLAASLGIFLFLLAHRTTANPPLNPTITFLSGTIGPALLGRYSVVLDGRNSISSLDLESRVWPPVASLAARKDVSLLTLDGHG
jgi:hypothetical protein